MAPEKFAALYNYEFKMEHKSESKPKSMQNYHYHNLYEIYYLCEGEIYYFIKDKCYKVKKGNLVFINKYDIHYTTTMSNQRCERYLINLKKEYLEDFFNTADIDLFSFFEKDIHIIEFNLHEQQVIESLMREILANYCSISVDGEEYLKLTLTELLIVINRHSNKLTSNNLGYMNSTHKTISEITGYINNNFSEDISLKSISDRFFISTYYFSRTFKKVTGLAFVDYLNSVRIKESQKLLHKTNMSITEIGEAVGFKSATHFGRIFKKMTGLSPLAYKKNN